MVHPSKTKHEIGKSKRNLLDQAKMTLLLKNDYLRKNRMWVLFFNFNCWCDIISYNTCTMIISFQISDWFS